ATTTRSVVTSVSQATRLVGSAARQWSRMASLTWSATLSGWPIDTLSLVNRYRSMLTIYRPSRAGRNVPAGAAGPPSPRQGMVDAVGEIITNDDSRQPQPLRARGRDASPGIVPPESEPPPIRGASFTFLCKPHFRGFKMQPLVLVNAVGL